MALTNAQSIFDIEVSAAVPTLLDVIGYQPCLWSCHAAMAAIVYPLAHVASPTQYLGSPCLVLWGEVVRICFFGWGL